MIRIDGLTKRFQDGERSVTILDDLDLDVAAGTFVSLVGRSGSGKSTLLNCIAGIETVDAGSIHIGETDVTRLSDKQRTILRRDRIGIIFQFFQLLPILRVEDNVALPALLRGEPRGSALKRARELLGDLGLGDRGGEMPDHLSGGEQQRVATARALINQPDLLLADEPTGNLDRRAEERTLEILRSISDTRNVTVLMVTHSPEAASIADRTLTLREGQLRPLQQPQPQP